MAWQSFWSREGLPQFKRQAIRGATVHTPGRFGSHSSYIIKFFQFLFVEVRPKTLFQNPGYRRISAYSDSTSSQEDNDVGRRFAYVGNIKVTAQVILFFKILV